MKTFSNLRLIVSLALLAGMAFFVSAQNSNSSTTVNTGKTTKTKTQPEATKPKTAPLIDINAASKTDLASLPGIGDVYAQKIIDGRPYKMKSDLKTKNIIPAGVYSKIAGKIIAHQPKP
jgi:competence protein ComEA